MTDRVTCASCGNDCSRHHFMCDVAAAGECWCSECFDATDCGQGKHGEGCPTQVFDDGAEATS